MPENNAASDIFTDGEPEHALEVIVYKFKYFNTLDFLFIEQFFFFLPVWSQQRYVPSTKYYIFNLVAKNCDNPDYVRN